MFSITLKLHYKLNKKITHTYSQAVIMIYEVHIIRYSDIFRYRNPRIVFYAYDFILKLITTLIRLL